jgi:polyphosphate glucokinase
MPVALDTTTVTPSGGADSHQRVLSIDIGGTLIKAAIVDNRGGLASEFLTTPTSKPATPEAVIAQIARLTTALPAFDRISVGFPGVVHRVCIGTAPNLGTEYWKDFDLEQALRQEFAKPVRILNDAIVYGLGTVKGPGRECVLTFGTGMGCALFCDGSAFHGLELGQHYACDNLNYDQYVGHAAYLAIGLEKWNDRVARVISAVHALTNSDHIYLGGGNSRRITFDLPAWATIAPLSAGVAGGARLWHADMERWFPAREKISEPQSRNR